MVKPTLLALSITAACPSIVYATDSLNRSEQQDLATQLQQLKLQVEALESRLTEQAKQKLKRKISKILHQLQLKNLQLKDRQMVSTSVVLYGQISVTPLMMKAIKIAVVILTST